MEIDLSAYKSFFENSTFPMLIIENGSFTHCNRAAVNILGYSDSTQIISTSPHELSPERQPCGRTSLEKAAEMIELAINNGSHQFEWQHRKKDGTIILVEVSLTTAVSDGTARLHVMWRDLSRRQRRDKELKESEQRFRQTFEANPDPVILSELQEGIIIDVNKAFETTTGITRIEAIGHNSEELGIWKDAQLRGKFREELIRKGEVNNFEAEFRVKGSRTKIGLLSARIIKIETAPFILIVIRDITKQKRAEKLLREMNHIKSEFISTAAHELRTPITGIMGYTELLSDHELATKFDEAQKQDFRDEISNNCVRLAKIVDDILDVSRIESGQRLPLEIETIPIEPLLNKIVRHFELKTVRQISISLKPGAPKTIKADEHRIRQVMDNLLSNAIKYSPKESKIEIIVEKHVKGCQICVSDHGIGMSEEQVLHIFDKFYRADMSDTSVTGLGLGMSIVKQIIEDHGGHVSVSSVLSQGTDVSFTIPSG